MRIGILAWGSLVYDWRDLKIENDQWFSDGPMLPIEFARISKKSKKLTLVICPVFNEIQTHYTISKCTTIEEAINELADREETDVENIGCINFKKGTIETKKMKTELKKTFSLWNSQHNFDALIWTDLNENFLPRFKKPFSLEASIEYLESLLSKPELFKDASDYILKTPEQTATKHRKALTEFLNKHMSLK